MSSDLSLEEAVRKCEFPADEGDDCGSSYDFSENESTGLHEHFDVWSYSPESQHPDFRASLSLNGSDFRINFTDDGKDIRYFGILEKILFNFPDDMVSGIFNSVPLSEKHYRKRMVCQSQEIIDGVISLIRDRHVNNEINPDKVLSHFLKAGVDIEKENVEYVSLHECSDRNVVSRIESRDGSIYLSNDDITIHFFYEALENQTVLQWLNGHETFVLKQERILLDILTSRGFNYELDREFPEPACGYKVVIPTSSQQDLDKLVGTIKRFVEGKDANKYDSIKDLLAAVNVPDQVIDNVYRRLEKLREIEGNDIISSKETFKYTDKDNKKWLLKISPNEETSKLEAACNYYLSDEFDFIAPGENPVPWEAEGLYVTIQEDISDRAQVARTVDYWIATLADFHARAAEILEENDIEIPEIKPKSAYEEKDRWDQGRRKNTLKFDPKRMEDSIAYLVETNYKSFIHNDTKPDNKLGSYLVDLELAGMGHPGIDIAMVLMEEGVHQDGWDHYLRMYLTCKNGNYTQDELDVLKEGVDVAAYYIANREIIGSSRREVRYNTEKENGKLVLSLDEHRREKAKGKIILAA